MPGVDVIPTLRYLAALIDSRRRDEHGVTTTEMAVVVAALVILAATAAALAVHVGSLYFPPTQYILRVEPIELAAWARIVAVATTILAAMEAHKWLRRPAPRRDGRPGAEAAR